MSSTLETGQMAPDFSILRDGGGRISLKDFSNQNLIIFFYPRDNTPGCTKEAIAFSLLLNQFQDVNTQILGISADTVKKHDNFVAKYDLKIPLGADTELNVLKAYDVWAEKSMYGRKYMGIVRTSILINSHGKIAAIWPKVKVNGHAEAVLKTCIALETHQNEQN